MNTRLSIKRQSGMVLPTTLVIALLVGIAVAGLLLVSQQQNYVTARSQTWASEIPIAEAGIEEAMAHLNSRPTNLWSKGWQQSGSGVWNRRTVGDGYYYTVISTSTTAPPVIVSIGYGRIPLQTNYSSRTVMAITKLTPPGWGVVGKTSVSMNGNPYVDSYDSSDPQFSTNGKWDINKRRDRVGVGSPSSATPAINTGGGSIYGSAATGPGGTVSGNVGDGAWISSGGGQQPGHITDDFNMAVDNASLPADWSAFPQTLPLPGIRSGTNYGYILTAGDWRFGATTISSSLGSIYVEGKVRVYFTGDFKMSSGASVTLAPDATLEMYMGGDMDLSGNCVINPSAIPSQCSIYGLPTCTSMRYSGTAAAYCKLYAPNADITVTGTFDFSGSVVGNRVQFSGTANIHYDEALRGDGPDYKLASWEEL